MQLEFAEIGGYFEFSLSNSAQFPYPKAFKYHSARSAFYDLIRKSKIKKIWMPRFICDSMLEPLKLLNVEVLFYNLQNNFFPILPEKLNSDEYLFYVNYFGICGAIQKELLKDSGADPKNKKIRIEVEKNIDSLAKELTELQKKQNTYLFDGKILTIHDVPYDNIMLLAFENKFYVKNKNDFYVLTVANEPQQFSKVIDDALKENLEKILFDNGKFE